MASSVRAGSALNRVPFGSSASSQNHYLKDSSARLMQLRSFQLSCGPRRGRCAFNGAQLELFGDRNPPLFSLMHFIGLEKAPLEGPETTVVDHRPQVACSTSIKLYNSITLFCQYLSLSFSLPPCTSLARSLRVRVCVCVCLFVCMYGCLHACMFASTLCACARTVCNIYI